MEDELPTWPRPYFAPGGSSADFLIVVFGQFTGVASPPFPRYRSAGVPSGFEVSYHSRREEPGVFRKLEKSPFWEIAAPRNRRVAAAAGQSPECVALQGSVPDPE